MGNCSLLKPSLWSPSPWPLGLERPQCNLAPKLQQPLWAVLCATVLPGISAAWHAGALPSISLCCPNPCPNTPTMATFCSACAGAILSQLDMGLFRTSLHGSSPCPRCKVATVDLTLSVLQIYNLTIDCASIFAIHHILLMASVTLPTGNMPHAGSKQDHITWIQVDTDFIGGMYLSA